MQTRKITDSGTEMSESFLTMAFLSLSGGLQDAYTYLVRGKVFANAQTGNVVLLSCSLFEGDWGHVLRYLIPLLFFAIGIAAAEEIRLRSRQPARLHWRQLVLLVETALLFLVGFLPEDWNLLANAVVSFSCAMQVQAFRSIRGYSFASTMCIGNIRSGVEALCDYRHGKDRALLSKAGCYFGVVLLFACGAGIGGLLSSVWNQAAIWASCLLLLVSFLLMFIRRQPAGSSAPAASE